MRIAITTTDGVSVNEHFGKSNSFYIYDIDGGVLKAIEKRVVESYCETSEGKPVKPDHAFSVDRFSVVYDKIKDCKVLYTQKIGDVPKAKLGDMGITVQLCSCSVESLVACNGNCK